VTIYLGPPGRVLTLPSVQLGQDVGLQRAGSVRQLLSGGNAVDTVGSLHRAFTLEWAYLSDANFAALEALVSGVYGPGPFVMIDTNRVNLLPPNVASPTSVRADTYPWGTSTGALSSVSTPTPLAGRRILSWTPGTAAAGNATVYGYAFGLAQVFAVPVVSGLTYSFSASLRTTTGSATMAARIDSYSASGVLLSNSSGSSTSIGTGAWTTRSVTAVTPNAAAVYVGPSVEVPAGTTTEVIVTDQWLMVTGGTLPSAWTRGTGAPRVMVDQLTDSYPLRGRHNVSLSLVEV
jgi:hypothetical protein